MAGGCRPSLMSPRGRYFADLLLGNLERNVLDRVQQPVVRLAADHVGTWTPEAGKHVPSVVLRQRRQRIAGRPWRAAAVVLIDLFLRRIEMDERRLSKVLIGNPDLRVAAVEETGAAQPFYGEEAAGTLVRLATEEYAARLIAA